MLRFFRGISWVVFLSALTGVTVGCFGSGGRPRASEWQVLDQAGKAACAVWPLREKDLQIRNIMSVQDKGSRGFVVSAQRRDTSTAHYYAPFEGDEELDAETFLPLDLGRGAILLGGIFARDGGAMALVGRNTGEDAAAKVTLEIRSIRDNVVRYKGPLGTGALQEGRVTPGGAEEAWLSLVFDDGTYRLVHLDLGSKTPVREVNTVARREPSRVLVRSAEPKGALLVWKEGDTGSPFRAQWVSRTGAAEPPVGIDLPVANKVESWTAIGHAGGYYLAVVDGDSLIGQSDLKVSLVNWGSNGPQVRWTKAAPLKDEHVTEPLFAESARGLQVQVLKWIDEESSIARYMVASGTIGKPKYSGVFQKGSRIVDAFTDVGGQDHFVLVRSRGEVGWTFRLCEI